MDIFILLVSSLALSTRIFYWQRKLSRKTSRSFSLASCGHCSSRAAVYSSASTVYPWRRTGGGWRQFVLPTVPSPRSSGRQQRRGVKPEAKRLCFLRPRSLFPGDPVFWGASIVKGEGSMLATHALRSKPRGDVFPPRCFARFDFLRLDINWVCVWKTTTRAHLISCMWLSVAWIMNEPSNKAT